MGCRVKKALAIRTLQAGILLLLASTANSTGLIDRMHSLAEQAWEDEYIPDSGIPAIPLTEYENFEVTELFRAVTIEELEAAITDGYPMPWLEETLKDESIPWEDRYWLDRRVRAAIAQNTHTFFNPAGNPVHIEADAVFPGELYWREHMIVDPAGWNAPDNLSRPTNLHTWDIGHLLNSFGNRIGEIALAIPIAVSISRDASVGVVPSGGNNWDHPDRQPYACFLSPDGFFREIPLSNIGTYDVELYDDATLAAFSFTEDRIRTHEEPIQYNVNVELFTGSGDFIQTVNTQLNLHYSKKGVITQDGHFLCHKAEGGNICLVNCETGESTMLEKPVWDQNTFRFRFSSNGSNLALSGNTTDRIFDLETDEQIVLPFNALRNNFSSYSSYACVSNIGITSSITHLGDEASYHRYLSLEKDNTIFYSEEMLASIHTYPLEAEFSPNGLFLITNPQDAAYGAPSPFCGLPPEANGLPLIVMQIEGR